MSRRRTQRKGGNYQRLGEMFEGDSADICAGKFPLVSMGGRAEGLACADPGGRTPIGVSGNFYSIFFTPPIHPITPEVAVTPQVKDFVQLENIS